MDNAENSESSNIYIPKFHIDYCCGVQQAGRHISSWFKTEFKLKEYI